MRRLRALALLVLIALPASANPLVPGARPPAEAPAASMLPEPVREVVQAVNRLQLEASRAMNRQVQALRGAEPATAAAWLMLIAFAYGVLHAAGPGHGKFVLSSYFLSRSARLGRGLLASGLAALAQAASAIAIVGVLAGVLDLGRMMLLERAALLEQASYGLIVLLGVGMLVQAFRGRHACCDAHDHHHDHDHDHPHHRHAHEGRDAPPSLRSMAAMAVAVGLRPCTGALILLLFTLANGLLPVGIAAVLAMALGVACTTSVIGLTSIGARRAVVGALGARPVALAWTERTLRVGGALAITAAGGLFLLASLAPAA